MTLNVGMLHWVPKYYQVCSNDDSAVSLTYFTARSNLVPYAFVWEKGKTINFSETIVVYDIKVGRCSQLNVYMNLYEYQWSRSFTDLHRRSLRFTFPNFFSSEATGSIGQFYLEPPWYREMKVSTNGLHHVSNMAAMPIYGKKTFQNLLFWNQNADDFETLACCIAYSSTIICVKMMTLG